MHKFRDNFLFSQIRTQGLSLFTMDALRLGFSGLKAAVDAQSKLLPRFHALLFSPFKVRDETVVKLTNQVHEMELNQVAAAATATKAESPVVGNIQPPIFKKTALSQCKQMTSNGLSFDNDRLEFREFVDVGSQTSGPFVDREKESLQDAVTAYEMQNKFLNKEVLELNHLRQQAVDREQKLFM